MDVTAWYHKSRPFRSGFKALGDENLAANSWGKGSAQGARPVRFSGVKLPLFEPKACPGDTLQR